jgi:MIP family channel proteins
MDQLDQQHHHRHLDQEQEQQPRLRPLTGSAPASKAKTLRLLPTYFVAELMGTFMLVLIGDGALAAYVFSNRPVDPFSVCLAFGVGAMMACYVSAKLSGAHLNPAATLAFALSKKLKWELVPVYMIAQYVGGFLAALVLFLNYSEAINSMDGGDHSAFGANHSTGGVFATYPAPFVTVWGSLIDQIVGTAVLLFALSAVGDKLNANLEDRLQPPIVALVIGFVCFAFSVNCGAIFNPARDLSPRLLTALLGYPAVWTPIDGTYWLLAGVVGPHIGAIVGVFSYQFLIGTSLEISRRYEETLQDTDRTIEHAEDDLMAAKSHKFALGHHYHHQQHHMRCCEHKHLHSNNNNNHDITEVSHIQRHR